jgi:hypothetical protein
MQLAKSEAAGILYTKVCIVKKEFLYRESQQALVRSSSHKFTISGQLRKMPANRSRQNLVTLDS